ncbi:phosphoheptose isomerase [archaeon]|nr:phosphoheptose isomerase [archaeon]
MDIEVIANIAEAIINCYKNDRKVLICGNGGSAADAQHIAGELVGRFKMERKALPCIALTTDTSIMTAYANDYSFDDIFERQVEALGENGDLLIGLSTSGNSSNVVKALSKAKAKGLTTIGLAGETGGKIKNMSDITFLAPTEDTPRIQECHITALHIICNLVEKELFGVKDE